MAVLRACLARGGGMARGRKCFLVTGSSAKRSRAEFQLGVNEKQRQKWALFVVRGSATPKEAQRVFPLLAVEALPAAGTARSGVG